MNVTHLFDQSPAERNATMRNLGQPRHCGPDDWRHDLAVSNARALEIIAAIQAGTPRPTYGRRRGMSADA